MMLKTKAFKALSTLLIITLIFVSGCGGGGGGPDAAEVEQLLICVIFPLFCIVPAANTAASGHILKGELIVPPDNATRLISSASDGRGNVYSAGYTAGSQAALEDDGDLDAIVLKQDPDRNLLWFRRFGSFDSESAEDVLVNSDGSVLVTIVKLQPMESDVYRMERKVYRLHLSDDGKVLDCSVLRVPDGT